MSTGLAVVLGIVAGLAVGAVIAWAVRSRGLKQVELERDKARDESDGQREALAELRAQLASAEADRAARVEEMAKQQAEIEGRFKEIAAQVSETTRDAFMKEFRDLSAEQTKTAGKTVSELVKPMRERLQELQEHVSKADKARVEDTAKVSQSVDQLVSETSGLRQILRDSKMRGAWGEQHLRNVIEAAGMSRHIDYIEQATVGELGAEGRLRPDVVVKVPGGASVVIDAKTPFSAYDRAVQTSDEAEQQQALVEHAAALSERAKELGDRDYGRWVSGSPDFVLMYVPTDPMLDVAMDVDSDVWQNAWHRHRVLIATPGLLIAFLRTVALAWQRQDIARNAEAVAKLGNDLYSRLSTYVEHVDKMGRGLRSAVGAYNDSVGSLQSRVLPQAKRFRDLGSVTGGDELDEPNPIELDVRAVTAAELEPGQD
ncbi:DNA recombination protein RmuC [Candidatus Poriferisodalis multihospitum]|uniref:DNA recombination protein RmuC n=1 Tax=Candidatus Poriferisodalis multihospitum TaxID=2983191 RepID=UPI002B256E40|nr:DNA recombination protein RmuC [Candidatus Poriferisodalis multihospitum]